MAHCILIADDEKEIRELLRLYLEKESYQVIEAENGADALEQCEKNEVDLVLLDIMMPKTDGYHVVKELRKIKNIPILILSAKTQSCDKILGLDIGADDYITKPFDPLEVLSRMNVNSSLLSAKRIKRGKSDILNSR